MDNLRSLLGPMRVPFLILTPACVLLGLGTAIWTTGRVNAVHVVLVLIGAVSAQPQMARPALFTASIIATPSLVAVGLLIR